MKNYILSILVVLMTFCAATAQSDSTIYDIVDQMPRFPMCESLDTTIAAKQECAQQALLSVIYQNVQYPVQARMDGIEGTVVVSFVVEPDSLVSNTTILRGIGGGCEEAVVNVVNAFNNSGIRWIPGQKAGQNVRTKMTIPIKFKLQEALPYVIIEGDTVYTQIDIEADFEGGDSTLNNYISENLVYPDAYQDTCLIGYMDVQLLVQPDGVVKTIDIADYSELGLDFQLEIIGLTTSMFNKWKPATYQDQKVPSAIDLRLTFIPVDTEGCKQEIENFEQANLLASEGIQLYNEGQQDAGLEKLSQAIQLTPNNAEYLISRGQAYVDAEKYAEACQDLFKVRQILTTSAYDQLLMIVCKMNQKEGDGN